MNKNTVYILQKDCLDAKAGDEFEFSESSDCYSKIGGDCQIDYLSALFVENNPEWFKPKEEVNESKPTEKKQWEDEDDDFLWTNELVMEFVNFHEEQKGIHWLSEDIEKFKKSKSKKEEPQWEILEIECYGGEIRKLIDDEYRLYPDGVGFTATYLLQRSDSKIKTVKRLSDGEVFSVGDYVEYIFVGASDNFYTPHLIKRFEIKDGVMYVQGEVPELFSFTLVSCKKSKAPKEEQVPIKVERIVFYTSMSEKPIRDVFSVRLTGDISEDKLQPIKKAIQSVINNDGLSEYFNKQPKLYSESELLQARRDAFFWARTYIDNYGGTGHYKSLKFQTVEDYINSLK